MSIRVSVLGSGSWGNATFIQFPRLYRDLPPDSRVRIDEDFPEVDSVLAPNEESSVQTQPFWP